jgi:hypothetical protein
MYVFLGIIQVCMSFLDFMRTYACIHIHTYMHWLYGIRELYMYVLLNSVYVCVRARVRVSMVCVCMHMLYMG